MIDLKKACLKRLKRLPLRVMHKAGINLYSVIGELIQEIHTEEREIKQSKCAHEDKRTCTSEVSCYKEGRYAETTEQCLDCYKVLSTIRRYK